MSYLPYDHGHMTSDPTYVFTAYLTTNPAAMYIASNNWMVVDNNLQSMWKKAAVT